MTEIIAIAGMFMVRVGIPIMALVFMGIMIDRWQTRREAEVMKQYNRDVEIDFKSSKEEAKSDEEQQTRKAA